jgi:hypothetical protein
MLQKQVQMPVQAQRLVLLMSHHMLQVTPAALSVTPLMVAVLLRLKTGTSTLFTIMEHQQVQPSQGLEQHQVMCRVLQAIPTPHLAQQHLLCMTVRDSQRLQVLLLPPSLPAGTQAARSPCLT